MKKLFYFLLFNSIVHISILYSQIWTEQVSGVTTALYSVSVIDNSNAWICGDQSTVLKTTNGGINWINVSYNGIPTNFQLVNIFGIDANNGIVAGFTSSPSGTSVFRTINGGTNWTQVFTQSNGNINAIWLSTNTQGIIVGNPVGGRWSIWKTTNGGLSWDSTGMYLPQNGSETGFNNCLYFSNNKFWFGTNNYRIYYSSNYGLSWIARSTSPEQNIYAICLYQGWFAPISGLAGGMNLLKSNDTGYTWTQISSLGLGAFGGFSAYPYIVSNYNIEDVGQNKYIRSDNKIYSSFVAGNWYIEYTAPSGVYKHIAQSRTGAYYFFTFAVRDNGGITRCTCPVGGLQQISYNIPNKFDLKQNYPNPFNPTTKIEFDIPKETSAAMKVYDITGKLIDILFDESLKPGSYSVTFDGINLASGIYFYSLQTSEFTKTNKMIILK